MARLGGRVVERGELLWEYRPPRAHPILYAALIVLAFVATTGSLENLVRESRADLYAAYWAPVAAVLLITLLLAPSAVRIYRHGIAPSRALVLRWFRPFVGWKEVTACYSASYDVTGAFVSPFASSDGKVTQTGLAFELVGGGTELLRFTPSRFARYRNRSRGYRQAVEVVQELYRRAGRTMVPEAEVFSAAQEQEMLAVARRPFLPFFAIVFLFASAAPVLLGLMKLGWPVEAALPVAIAVPAATSTWSYIASRRRNRILNALSKAAAYRAESA